MTSRLKLRLFYDRSTLEHTFKCDYFIQRNKRTKIAFIIMRRVPCVVTLKSDFQTKLGV